MKQILFFAVLLIIPQCNAMEKSKTPEPVRKTLASAAQKTVSFTSADQLKEQSLEGKADIPVWPSDKLDVVLKKKDSPLSERRAKQRKLKAHDQKQIPKTI